MLNDLINDEKVDSMTCWVDMLSLGAPSGWNGKTWVSVSLQLIAPNRSLSATILETRDQMPDGETAVKPMPMGVAVAPCSFVVPEVSGPVMLDAMANEPIWKDAVEFSAFNKISGRTAILAVPGVKTTVKLCHDGRFLYAYYACSELAGRKPDCSRGASGQPYLSDSVEFFLQNASRKDQVLHCIVDANKNQFCEISDLKRSPGAKVTKLSECPFKFATRVYDGGWDVEAAIPLSELGVRQEGKDVEIGFNLMRNRLDANGQLECLSFVPVNSYFTGDIYKLVIKDYSHKAKGR